MWRWSEKRNKGKNFNPFGVAAAFIIFTPGYTGASASADMH
jgi:hypothetical protein